MVNGQTRAHLEERLQGICHVQLAEQAGQGVRICNLHIVDLQEQTQNSVCWPSAFQAKVAPSDNCNGHCTVSVNRNIASQTIHNSRRMASAQLDGT